MFFGRNFYRRLTVEFSMTSKYRYAVSVSLKFGDIIFEYFFYKRVFGFLPFYFYYIFEKIFLFQSKTKYLLKYVNQNFTSNKLNEKKSEPFCKKANLWKFGGLTNFFWNFYGKLELVKVRNVHQEVTFFCRQNYFSMKPDKSMINPVFQNKSGVNEKNGAPCFFRGSNESISTTQPTLM